MLEAVARMFKVSRGSNALRHLRNGTLITHLIRKTWIKTILRIFRSPV